MQETVLKRLVESYSVDELSDAEEALLEEEALPFEIEGADDSEVLNHIIGSIWIIEKMESHDVSFSDALKAYSKK